MSEELKTKIKRAWEEAFNQGKMDGLDELVAPNWVRHKPPFPDIVGLDALKKFITDCRTSYPDVNLTIEKVIIDGDWIASQWTYEGTQSGVSPSTGAPPSNKHVKIRGCDMGRWENDKVVEDWNHGDWLGLMHQIGVVPKSW
ncbi:ester cyclase [Desulfosarcina sp.]|nr:ester cyclase [Desulfosarcina sp.]